MPYQNPPPLRLLPPDIHAVMTAWVEARDEHDRHEATAVGLGSPAAVEEARAADGRALLAALEAGADPVDVGQPAEARRLAQVDAHARAAALTAPKVVDLEDEVAAALLANADAILDLATAALPKAAEKYAGAIAALQVARREYEEALAGVEWAARISPARRFPSFSANPETVRVHGIGMQPVAWRDVLSGLNADARRHEDVLAARTKRVEQAERDRQAREANQARLAAEAAARQRASDEKAAARRQRRSAVG